MELSVKQMQFNAAMEIYISRRTYKLLGIAVSITNVSLQLYLFFLIQTFSISAGWQVFSVILAYFLTDFINGLVHLFMDNNDRYETFVGPLIANFHLHHKTPQYKKHNLLFVYFTETGSKIWLVGYLLAILILCVSGLNHVVLGVLVYIGIFSSCAEVSHYLCHTSNSVLAAFLSDCGLLLSKRHHAKHHLQDNINFAFLNGCSDPLLNRIAAVFSKGYKHNTDLHYAHYAGLDNEER